MSWKTETSKWGLIKEAWSRLVQKQKDAVSDMFQFDTRERRESFRIKPSENAPVRLRFNGVQVDVLDISADGLSFKNQMFSQADVSRTCLEIPWGLPAIPVVLEIIDIDDKDVCHCKFNEIDEEGIEQIHQYVLIRQKEIIYSKKKQKKGAKNLTIRVKPEPDEPVESTWTFKS